MQFVAITLALTVTGYCAVIFVSLGNCGMGPDAQQSCYEAQTPWVWATVLAFAVADAAAAILLFRRKKGR
jgi:hypothetical protein